MPNPAENPQTKLTFGTGKTKVIHPLGEGLRVYGQTVKGKGFSVVFDYDDTTSFTKWLESTSNTSPFRASQKEPSEEWDNGLGYQGTVDMTKVGYAEGVKNLNHAYAQLPQSTTQGMVIDHDVAGGDLDVGAFCAGDPCHYDVDPDEDSLGETKVIRLLFPQTANCYVTAKQYANRGAALVAIVDALERGGRQVEIVTETSFHSSSWGDARRTPLCVTQKVTIKRAGTMLDLTQIATWLMHPAVFRRLGFAFLENVGAMQTPVGSVSDRMTSCYGCAGRQVDMSEEPSSTVHFPKLEDGRHDTPAESMASLTKVFEQAGYTIKFD